MPATSSDRQRPNPANGGYRQIAAEMREKITVARGLPSERFPGKAGENIGIDGNQNEIGLPGKMPCCRFADLRGGREMDIAIGDIHRRAGKAPGRLRLAP